MKQKITIPASIRLFAKYLRNELTKEERIQFDGIISYTQDEDSVCRKVKMLETIFPNDTHRIESLVRNNSEGYVKDVERFGCMGHRLDTIIAFLSEYEGFDELETLELAISFYEKLYENRETPNWDTAKIPNKVRS